MAGKGRKFDFLGAFKLKRDAKRRERSADCGGKCFILPRKTQRGKRKRFIVLRRRDG